ncbi:PCYCGC motif-containing (lipo)protein [Peribacillus acanthi]|uniref:PCYCGC motif-containing (lipo)protein n=1 Tax=Peribacillus acanthi TaxID=2171554 RepID=UPI000D3E19A1|nr:PCYCGC motif-containing (lipo)protein [Peribacillus acanthi]
MKKARYLLIVCSLVFWFALTGCAKSNEETTKNNKDHENAHTSHAKNGDLQETTSSKDIAPKFLNEKPEDMKTIYLAAANNKELLEQIPCYCGCGDSAGHRDNYDCFIHDNKEDGRVVWDDHGTRCGVCLETAVESILQLKDGKSVKEIRDYIDQKYKEGFAKPTPTPMPKG